MTMDPKARRLLDMLGAGRGIPAAPETAALRRAALRDLAEIADDRGEGSGESCDLNLVTDAGPVPARLYSPPDAPIGALPALVFFHGGGWVAGGLDTHDGLCRRLAAAAGCRVIALDYPLAPEHPFPVAIDAGLGALAEVARGAQALGVDPARLVVGGDSAGATIAAAVCQSAQLLGGPAIAAQLLICPILDVAEESPSRKAFAEGHFLERATLERDLADYCPGADRADRRLSPLRAASLAGQPPTLIHTAEFDPFRDEGQAYAARLRQAGVRVTATCHPGMIHYFYAMARAIPYARTAAAMIGEELRQALAGS
ncbi:MAG: alpha/beta hydrolase [Caulobacterales bacterium]